MIFPYMILRNILLSPTCTSTFYISPSFYSVNVFTLENIYDNTRYSNSIAPAALLGVNPIILAI